MISLPVQTSQTTQHQAVCPYCGVGCVVQATVADNRIESITADERVQPNRGMLCHKGVNLGSTEIHTQGRLTHPMIRRSKSDPLQKVSWDEAADFIAQKLLKIRSEYGPHAIGCYGSGQLDTEASYILSKLIKGSLGTNNMDTNSRLCMSSAAAGYTLSLGSDGPPTCYDDLREADVFFLIGANMQVNHPVLFNFIRQRRAQKKGVVILVADPRKTKTAQAADLHLPVAPGGDVAMLQWIARRLLLAGKCNEAFVTQHTEGFDAWKEMLLGLDECELQQASGLTTEIIDRAVACLGGSPRVISLYCMGVNQSSQGVEKNLAIINLHLQLGAIGKIGAGPFSLTGQPNAMGGRECGYMAHQLPGYRFVHESHHRAEVEMVWNLPAGSISAQPGLSAIPMFQAAARGEIQALWIVCTNPAVSMPDVTTAQAGLRRAQCVIVQDCYELTETAAFADVLLPAAQWGEKTGTMTNSERLVVRSRAFLQAPGQAREDWWIVCRIAQAMGMNGFDFQSSEEIWDEYRKLTRGTVCDQFGMTNDRLNAGPLRWPCPDEDHPGSQRLYTDARFPTPSGKARFIPVFSRNAVDEPDEQYPLILTTGRVSGQWHTRTRTGKVPALNQMDPEPLIEIHPLDAARQNLCDGQRATLIGRRGCAQARLRITPHIRPGVLFMPFHWGDLFASQSNVNDLTSPAIDPISKQPELKYCAVRLEPVLQDISAANGPTNTATPGEMIMHPSASIDPSSQPNMTPEQREYQHGFSVGAQLAASLQGLLAKGGSLALPQVISGQVVPGGPRAPSGPDSIHWQAQQNALESGKKLTTEEEAKRSKNPLDMWDELATNAQAARFPKGTDGFLYRYQGLFYVAPAQDAYMCRMRLPGGHMTSVQMRGVAQIADQLAGSYADVTTRANLQLRQIKAENALNVLTALQDLGIVARGSGADNIRNVTSSPLSGMDQYELIETLPLAREMHYHILHHRELYGLPRKFNIAFDGGGAISALEDTNDIGFSAVKVPDASATADVPAGIYFRLSLGGITGHQDFARDTGILLKPDECVAVASAMVKVFIAHGDRTDRKKARLKYLLDAWGFEKFITHTQEIYGRTLRRFPLANCETKHEPMRQAHVGFHAQKQPGMNYVGLVLPVGRMTSAQMRSLAMIAERFGTGILRLTVWQNLLIPDIADADVEAVKQEIEIMGLHWQASAIRAGMVACTGSQGCRYASADTKGHAMMLTSHLESRLQLDHPINIHLTGCHHSCAQHYIGDIGLLATKVTLSDEQMVEGYHIFVGGGYAEQAQIGRQIAQSVPIKELPARLEHMLTMYLQNRFNSETFSQFTRRQSLEELTTLFTCPGAVEVGS